MAATKIEKPETEKTEKTYRIRLPLSREKQDDVFVGINGQTYLIKRGEEVEVNQSVYEVLKNSEKMDNLALTRQKALESQE